MFDRMSLVPSPRCALISASNLSSEFYDVGLRQVAGT
jgi:hypothetical protein